MQLLENIFSVKNDNLHKVITILFFKLKFRNQKLFEEKRIANIENQLVSVNENIEKLNNTIENILKKTQSSQINILNIAKAIRNETYTVRNKILKICSESEISQLQNREIIYANVLRDCTSNADWLKEKDWTLTAGAANYSFIYILFKILEETTPENILEFGLGQTSKMTTQYAIYKNTRAKLNIIDNNSNWIKHFSSKQELRDNIKIHHKNIIKIPINNVESEKYDNLNDITSGQKYDLIIIDGPLGLNKIYPRTNILDLIPDNLADDFVIILDDAERLGERNTANLIFEKLKENNILYKRSYETGLKKQLIISSINYEFLHWY